MNLIGNFINKIICGNALKVLKEIPDGSVNCCICSPPYWNLRDYGVDGQLGLEKTFELYIEHLCQIFDEVKRVLRKDGTCWVNLGDSYGGSGNRSGHTLETSNLNRLTIGYGATEGNQKATKGYEKSLLDIPYRFSIEMTNRGWIKRNTIIWYKANCLPSSARDRFTVDFEYLFFFTKNNKAIFWTNEKTLECINKKPLGIKGIEGKDWEWRTCPKCQGKGEIIGKALKEGAASIVIGNGIVNKNTKAFRICPRCKGSGKVKYSFWTGHDYWFEQQFEELNYDSFRETKRGKNQPKAKIGDLMSASVNARKSLDKWKINLNGRNRRCVWKISIKGFPEAHFAVYPEGLIEIPIKAGCPQFVCKECGKARVRIYNTNLKDNIYNPRVDEKYSGGSKFMSDKTTLRCETETKEIGYSDCGCKNPEYEGGIVLDPFMGAGTTALVALKQRKRFIGIEIKQEYIDMANKRIAKVQQEIF